MQKGAIALIVVLVAAAFIAMTAIFTVDERQKATVLQFGQVRAVKEVPGLAFKLPFVQNVVYYDSRIQGLDTNALEVTPLDDRRLIVDAFARWRIADVEQFRRAVGAGGMEAAAQRLEAILNANVREALGAVPSDAVLSADRVGLMNRIRDAAIIEARNLGIEIVDVRLKRADLPEQNLAATFDRMQAERQREAADERARGQEAAQRVRAQADRTAVEIVSEADRDANIIRGEADAERNRILAEAFTADEEFFAFLRSMQAYQASLNGDNTTMMVQPDSDFFDYLQSPDGRGDGSVNLSAVQEPQASDADPALDAAPDPEVESSADGQQPPVVDQDAAAAASPVADGTILELEAQTQ